VQQQLLLETANKNRVCRWGARNQGRCQHDPTSPLLLKARPKSSMQACFTATKGLDLMRIESWNLACLHLQPGNSTVAIY
jgi:hypothetical protein